MCVESDKNEIEIMLKWTNFRVNWTGCDLVFFTAKCAKVFFALDCVLSSQSCANIVVFNLAKSQSCGVLFHADLK